MINWADGFPMTAGPRTIGVSEASPETKEFWDAVGEDRLLLKQCRCKTFLHPRRIACPFCGSLELKWVESKGEGEVYSCSEIHRAAQPEMEKAVPYTVGIVKLAEGVHLFGRLFGEGAPVQIGAPVRMEFRTLELGDRLPIWIVTH